MTLTSHNEYMSNNTATIRETHWGTTSVIQYANNETATTGVTGITSWCEHSTAIACWSYFPTGATGGELVVRYTNSETYYRYMGVPMRTLFLLFTADSLGSFFATEVKPNFPVEVA